MATCHLTVRDKGSSRCLITNTEMCDTPLAFFSVH
uniref:Uncharacterized protein n=1 Tax=Anguilla anguilla TaxID=7936 RepID=A0A0E9TM41_ANGAN